MAIIQRLDGTEYDLTKYGIRTRDIVISSPSYRHNMEEASGRPGAIDMGSDPGTRSIMADFRSVASDYADFPLLRDEIFNIFRSDEAFYFIEKRNPGKRWLVKVNSTFDMEQSLVYGDFQVNMTSNRAFSESVGTTLSSLTWDSGLWQWGQGLPFDDHKYEHTTNQFTIYNAGNVVVDPRYMDLIITIEGTATEYVELINKTTGDMYLYNGKLLSGDELVINGIRSTKNDLSVFRDTNKKLITLALGPNEFEIKGATVERILFDFRFYYK